AGEEHGDERKGEGLPAAAADDHPCLVMSLAVAVFASRALSEQLALWLIKWISEQHSKEGAPRHPACSILKMRRKQGFIVHRIEDGEVPSIASCRFARRNGVREGLIGYPPHQSALPAFGGIPTTRA